jgi:C-terminal processing protease CtpA/Prc
MGTVVVARLEPGGPAEKCGLIRVGDYAVRINGEKPRDARSAAKRVQTIDVEEDLHVQFISPNPLHPKNKAEVAESGSCTIS